MKTLVGSNNNSIYKNPSIQWGKIRRDETYRYWRCSSFPSSGTRCPERFELPKSLFKISKSHIYLQQIIAWEKNISVRLDVTPTERTYHDHQCHLTHTHQKNKNKKNRTTTITTPPTPKLVNLGITFYDIRLLLFLGQDITVNTHTNLS